VLFSTFPRRATTEGGTLCGHNKNESAARALPKQLAR
jgi:hypothetical protein